MASSLDGVNFRTIRPSPTNPHKKPTYIEPGKISTLKRGDSTSSSEMSQKEEIQANDPDQTVVLQPWSKTEPRSINGDVRNTGEMELVTRNASDDDKEKQTPKSDRQWVWWFKFAAAITVFLTAGIAAILFISYYDNPHKYHRQTGDPSSKASQFCTRSLKDVNFNDILVMRCKLEEIPVSLNITFNPEYGSYRSVETLHFNLSDSRLSEQGWNISTSGKAVNITKSPAKCNSGGHYTFIFVSEEKMTFNHTEFVTIKNKLSDVSLEVEQNNETDSGFYQISCSARSGCTPAPISLLGVFTGDNAKTEPIFGVNFTCTINYNDNDGWTVGCTGTVPESVYSSLNSIACRPTTGNKEVDDEKEIKYTICKNCIFECPASATDSYWYDHQICNIFHRCSDGVLYTQPCPPTTYFNTLTCACDFSDNLPGKCDINDRRVDLLSERKSCKYEGT